jgi:hypothetical protein
MQKLKDRVYTNGCYYNLISRSEHWAIYSQHYSPDSPIIAYEVFRIRITEERTMRGKTYPKREAFPSTSKWGIDAWTISDKTRALETFLSASKKEHLKETYHLS